MKTFLLILLFPLAALAQTETLGPNDLRDRAFKMAKATVEFLATDAKTYGYPDKTTCPDCVSYQSLKAFIVEQKLTKADELVNETERWAAAPATTAKAPATALAELRTQLMNRVTAGSERQHRRSLPSFSTYESQMNQLTGGIAPASIAMNAGQQKTDAPDVTADVQDAQSDTAYADETVVPLSQAQSADGGWVSKSGLALLLSLLSLALLSWLLFFRKKGDNGSKPTEAGSDMKVAQLNDELIHVKGDLRRTIDANGKLQNRVEQLENQVSVLQKAVGVASAVLTTAVTPASGATAGTNQAKETPPAPNQGSGQRQQGQSGQTSGSVPPNPAPTTRSSQQAPSPPSAQAQPANPAPAENRPRSATPGAPNSPQPSASASPVPSPPPLAPSAPRIFYARTVDLGDGFSVESLSETTSERPMVYQIQVQTPGQATFRVADDPYAQRLALSDPYSYLNDACEYTSQPAPNSRITTSKPGRLVLQGNKWAIQEKAQIGFS